MGQNNHIDMTIDSASFIYPTYVNIAEAIRPRFAQLALCVHKPA